MLLFWDKRGSGFDPTKLIEQGLEFVRAKEGNPEPDIKLAIWNSDILEVALADLDFSFAQALRRHTSRCCILITHDVLLAVALQADDLVCELR